MIEIISRNYTEICSSGFNWRQHCKKAAFIQKMKKKWLGVCFQQFAQLEFCINDVYFGFGEWWVILCVHMFLSKDDVDGLGEDWCISIANALETLQSCTKPLMQTWPICYHPSKFLTYTSVVIIIIWTNGDQCRSVWHIVSFVYYSSSTQWTHCNINAITISKRGLLT